ncbi:hypothetical protein MPL3356_340184 [Mesorhizobium plurifarium]|uniref:Uncharacterized protein n=1 Tax=Mesorhizobium plurifarium TaxID=69974 RepID=A0A090FQ80_MESPL|nr:hypothetical protein MPL3356_340184 [Mesorhizobium plurifarium]
MLSSSGRSKPAWRPSKRRWTNLWAPRKLSARRVLTKALWPILNGSRFEPVETPSPIRILSSLSQPAGVSGSISTQYAYKGWDGVIQAAAPARIIESGIPIEALLAQIAVSK